MAALAVIGGDDRVHDADFGDDVRVYAGNEHSKLINAAKAGNVNGVVALSKWIYGPLKSALRALPPSVPVVFYSGSIRSLEKEWEGFTMKHFARAPGPKVSAPLSVAIREHVQKKQLPPPPEIVPAPVIALREEPPAPEPEKPAHGFLHTPWSKEETDALMIACEENDTWKDRVETFYMLTGQKLRTGSAIQQRYNDVRAKQKEAAKHARKNVTITTETIAVTPAPAPSPPSAAARAPPRGNTGSARTVKLRTGGEIAIHVSVDLFNLKGEERKLLFTLIDFCDAYENGNGSTKT